MAELTDKKRSNLPDSDFAIVKTVRNKTTGKPMKERSYPIHDLPHARNALSRVSTFGTPEEKAAVRSKVCTRYKELPTCKRK